METLLSRVDHLERALARSRRWHGVTAVLLAVIVLVAAGQDKPQTVEAERFVLVDAEGNQQATLGAFGDGRVGLSIGEPQRTEIVFLGLSGYGEADLSVIDKEWKKTRHVPLRGPAPTGSPTLPAKSPTTAAKPVQPEVATFYVTNSGLTYHRSGCRYLKSSKIAISLADAKRGYSACRVCKP